MKPERIKALFPNASQDFQDLNVNRRSSGAEPESIVHDGADGQTKGKEKNSGRCSVSITAYRARAIDPDNLCAKYFVDALRYAGLLYDDRPQDILYQISQKKVPQKIQEKTLIELSYDT